LVGRVGARSLKHGRKCQQRFIEGLTAGA
jgi:hypothetical protein